MEWLFGLLFEAPVEAAMKNRKLTRSVKTALYCVLSSLLVAFCAWLTYIAIRDGDTAAGVITGVISLFLGVLYTWGAVRGHKMNWKNDRLDPGSFGCRDYFVPGGILLLPGA